LVRRIAVDGWSTIILRRSELSKPIEEEEDETP